MLSETKLFKIMKVIGVDYYNRTIIINYRLFNLFICIQKNFLKNENEKNRGIKIGGMPVQILRFVKIL